MVISPDYTSPREFEGDDCYWVERVGGKTKAWAHTLIEGTCDLDPKASPREIDCAGLPTQKLRGDYRLLITGRLPSRESKSTATLYRDKHKLDRQGARASGV